MQAGQRKRLEARAGFHCPKANVVKEVGDLELGNILSRLLLPCWCGDRVASIILIS